MARLSEQEVNAALDLLNRLADEVQAEHPDLDDEDVAAELLGARIARLPASKGLLILHLCSEQAPTVTLYRATLS